MYMCIEYLCSKVRPGTRDKDQLDMISSLMKLTIFGQDKRLEYKKISIDIFLLLQTRTRVGESADCFPAFCLMGTVFLSSWSCLCSILFFKRMGSRIGQLSTNVSSDN